MKRRRRNKRRRRREENSVKERKTPVQKHRNPINAFRPPPFVLQESRQDLKCRRNEAVQPWPEMLQLSIMPFCTVQTVAGG